MGTGAVVGLSSGVDRDVQELVYRSCMLLDENDFMGWIGLCAPSFRYTITAWSPEIRREQTWLDHDYEGISNLMKMLPKHNTLMAPMRRHAVVNSIEYDDAKKQATVTTSFVIFRITLDGGVPETYAVGRYLDTVSLEGDAPRLTRRQVKLDTRNFGIGTHWPL